MKNLYIFDDHQLSSGSGVGTFLRDLIRCSEQWEAKVQITMIMLRSNAEVFCSYTRKKIHYFFIPNLKNISDVSDIVSMLDGNIINDRSSVFIYNYMPSDHLIHDVCKFFPKTKQLCIVHDFCWTAHFLGDWDLFRQIINTHIDDLPIVYRNFVDLYKREQSQLSRADKVVCLSEDSFRILEESYFVPKDKIIIIPHGMLIVDDLRSKSRKERLKRQYYIGAEEKVILFVGRIGISKGIFALLNAFKLVLKNQSNCRLVIVGELCNAPDLLAVSGDVVAKVTFTGQLTQENLGQWYELADIGVIPSYTEQCSYVGLEMMKSGLPVIASDGLGVRCMFEDRDNAIIAHIRNREVSSEFEYNIANSILFLLDNPEEGFRLTERSFKILKHKYNFRSMTSAYKAVIDSL
ncbi:MAG: glycosyltransferase [Tannerellaceae bacterium]